VFGTKAGLWWNLHRIEEQMGASSGAGPSEMKQPHSAGLTDMTNRRAGQFARGRLAGY